MRFGTEATKLNGEVNVAAPLRLAQLWAQSRVEQKLSGAVVNVSSQSSTRVIPAHTSYSVSLLGERLGVAALQFVLLSPAARPCPQVKN